MSESCTTCRFGLFEPEQRYIGERSLVSKQARVICRRFPTVGPKNPGDWCGEYQQGQATQSKLEDDRHD